jgi:hypothetical protein
MDEAHSWDAMEPAAPSAIESQRIVSVMAGTMLAAQTICRRGPGQQQHRFVLLALPWVQP